MKILCLEDELNTAIIIKTYLVPDEVVIKTSLRDAVALLRQENFDFLVIDLGLPDSQGLDTLKALDEFDIPRMVITADDDEDIFAAATFLTNIPEDYVLKQDYPGIHLLRKIKFNVTRLKRQLSSLTGLTFESFEEIKQAIASPIQHKHLVAH